MSKKIQKSNKEARKPKKEVPKVVAGAGTVGTAFGKAGAKKAGPAKK